MRCSTRRRYPPHTRRRQPPPAKAALGAALARFDNRPNCPAHQPLPSHCVSGSGARGIRSPLNRQCHPPYQFREISTVKFAPAAPRKEVLKRSFKWRFLVTFFAGDKSNSRSKARNSTSRARRRRKSPAGPGGGYLVVMHRRCPVSQYPPPPVRSWRSASS